VDGYAYRRCRAWRRCACCSADSASTKRGAAVRVAIHHAPPSDASHKMAITPTHTQRRLERPPPDSRRTI
ncbi:hypothetical protein, partial [Xanthomonas fragariae]|uniref:hypothetical protein n=1 Tax=Xanthomonas fragariae TaxID=48664 RepID=UPI0031B5C855